MVNILGGLTSVQCINLQHKYILVASLDCSHNAQHAHFVEQLSSTFTPPSRLLSFSPSLLCFPPSSPAADRLMQWLIAWEVPLSSLVRVAATCQRPH